ncbi:MAG: DUF790 family protein [Myxococcales bacterium]|nr:DUF790 family protein [Myxococcales bacterium]
MLPSGLLRAKVSGSSIAPSLVVPAKPAIAAAAREVFSLFSEAAAQRRRLGEVNADVDALCSERRDHRMVRGLAHLARGRCTLHVATDHDPATLRAEVFERSAAVGPLALVAGPFGRPTAHDVLAEVGRRYELSAEELSDLLFADLESERRVVELDVPSEEWLLHRYNVALVQGLLCRATEVRIALKGATTPRLKQLFRWVKFHQLLHRVSSDAEGVTLVLDGPMSMFAGSTRYGRQLARFLPALCLQEADWTLDATVLWTRANHRKALRVTSRDGLVSHYADTGAYRSPALQKLAAGLAEAPEPWLIRDAEAPLTLGPSALVFPDFTATDGVRTAHLEVWGHWRGDALQQRLEAMERYDRSNVVLAVSRRLSSGKSKAIPEHPQVLPFTEVLSVKQAVARLDQVARSDSVDDDLGNSSLDDHP